MRLITIVVALLLPGCAAVDVRITKPDGTTIIASGFSCLKDHGLESLHYGRTHDERGKGLVTPATSSDAADFTIGGYSSQARVDAILKLLEAMR